MNEHLLRVNVSFTVWWKHYAYTFGNAEEMKRAVPIMWKALVWEVIVSPFRRRDAHLKY